MQLLITESDEPGSFMGKKTSSFAKFRTICAINLAIIVVLE